MTIEQTILNEASALITGSRATTHGDYRDSFKRTADIFNAWTGHDLTPVEIAMIMQCLKMSREFSNPTNRDNYVDQAGYLELRYKLKNDKRMGHHNDPNGAGK